MKGYRLITPSGIYTCAFVNAKQIFSVQAGVMDYVTVSLYTDLLCYLSSALLVLLTTEEHRRCNKPRKEEIALCEIW